MAFSPDGSLLASSSGGIVETQTIRLWDVATGEQLAVIEGHTEDITAVVFSPEGEVLASRSNDGTVRLWDVQTYSELAVLELPGGAGAGLAFSPDGRLLAAAGGTGSDHTLHVWGVN